MTNLNGLTLPTPEELITVNYVNAWSMRVEL